ncbi:hypothetical protein BGW38_007369, partial [Lunasporangiospora selenospora]
MSPWQLSERAARGQGSQVFDVNYDEPTIANFARLNQMDGGRWVLLPMASISQSFVRFSERNLLPLLFKRSVLRKHIVDLFLPPAHLRTSVSNLCDGWLPHQGPRALISTLLTTVGRGRSNFKKPTSYQRSTKVWTLDQYRDHLKYIRDPSFTPSGYEEKGYLLRGSILTDGFRLLLVTHKLKELKGVRYKRMQNLPPPLTSTLDYFLSEVRNILKSKEIVGQLWNCDPKDIKVIGVDLGKAFTVGASALLPVETLAMDLDPPNVSATEMDLDPVGVSVASMDLDSPTPLTPTSASAIGAAIVSSPPKFHNLKAKQKALYQPTFKFRAWLREKKSLTEDGRPSIQEIETNAPPYRGANANFAAYANYMEQHQEALRAFYGKAFKKHQWESKKAREAEFATLVDQILKLVGGSIGKRRNPDDHVVIGIGLGQFSIKSGLSSLHETFSSYLIKR